MRIPADNERCLHTKANGHRCRRLQVPGQSLCTGHLHPSPRQAARNAQRHDDMLRDYFSGAIAAQLFPSKRDRRLDSAQSVNRFLARVTALIAERKIDPKTGSALCYAGQTILSTLPHIARERAALAEAQQHPIFSPAQLASAAELAESLGDYVESSGHADASPAPLVTTAAAVTESPAG